MELCAQAAEEKDPDKFLQLIRKINDLLEEKERSLGIVSPNAKRASESSEQRKPAG
jgi:hypothetical protein